MSAPVLLSRRCVLQIVGTDAASFLNGLLTGQMLDLEEDALRYCALLTPQGKVLADLFVCRRDGAFLLDAPASQREALPARLAIYRLHAQLEISARPDLGVFCSRDDRAGYPDPRHPDMPFRQIASLSGNESDDQKALADYELTRILHCAPEGDLDFAPGEVFPADINMDLLSGVDFNKGCFVGQEVVSRMKRKSLARRRSLALRFCQAAPAAGSAVTSNGKPLGIISSNIDEYALARLRVDRLAEQENSELQAEGLSAKCHISSQFAASIFPPASTSPK